MINQTPDVQYDASDEDTGIWICRALVQIGMRSVYGCLVDDAMALIRLEWKNRCTPQYKTTMVAIRLFSVVSRLQPPRHPIIPTLFAANVSIYNEAQCPVFLYGSVHRGVLGQPAAARLYVSVRVR